MIIGFVLAVLALGAALDQFVNDPTVVLILALVALDAVLGPIAAIVNPDQKFRVGYLANFLQTDVLGKVVPYFAIWWVLHISGADFTVLGFDAIEEVVGAYVVLQLGNSVLNSLRDLSIPLVRSLPDTVAGPDPTTPG